MAHHDAISAQNGSNEEVSSVNAVPFCLIYLKVLESKA